jgi:DNA recombination protein RmuC
MDSANMLLWIVLGTMILAALAVVLAWLAWRSIGVLANRVDDLPTLLARDQEVKHREMLADLAEGLAKQGTRINQGQSESALMLRAEVSKELQHTRESVGKLQFEQSQRLAENKETLLRELLALTQLLGEKQDALKADMLGQTLAKLNEQALAQQEATALGLQRAMAQINERIELMTATNDKRLADISGKVNERLDEGFKKTNETFVSVMTRLATIDEAQKKIDGLTTNVVSLQQLLGDKKSRGAFGEMQLEQIVRNMLPETSFGLQYTFANGTRADCVLMLPEPVGLIAIDSKFPLENYERMISDGEDRVSPAVFKQDVKKHVSDIAAKYIIEGVTSDGAMMFVPAEAVFAEIHARHRDVVEFAQSRRVWIVSPTTLMAVLNTVRAVLKDVETRRQVHIIKDELGKLGKEFGRFDERMKKLADHIRQANKDVEEVSITSKKISDRFSSIERVELGNTETSPALTDAPNVVSFSAAKSDLFKDQ